MGTSPKTTQLLVYLIKNKPRCSVTSLMKLTYLIDLISLKKLGHKVTDFEYQRHNFGPFNKAIYNYLDDISLNQGLIKIDFDYAFDGSEYVIYEFNKEKEDFEFKDISKEEFEIIDNLLADLGGLGAKELTQVAYRTKPMQKLGATLGGNENMGQVLDLLAT